MQALLKEAVQFAFKDRSWILKILIGGLLGLIPIVNIIFLIGYSIAVLRDSVDNKPATLPEWSAWQEFGKNGLYGLLVLIAYGIPLLFLGVLSTTPALGKIFYVLFVLANLVIVPLFTLALIRWHKQGNWIAAFSFKDVWQSFTKDIKNYLIATVVICIAPFLVSLVLQYSGYGLFHLHSPVLFFPGALLHLVLGCLWFWLSLVGARLFGQITIAVEK